MDETNPTEVYTMAIVCSYAGDGKLAEVFAEGRDNPKIPKAVLMAAAIAGFHAGRLFQSGKTPSG